MQVDLLYGKHGMIIEVPDKCTTVIRPKFVNPVSYEIAAIRQALRSPIGSPPLRELVNPDDTVAIVFSDITRPMPYERILPVLFDELTAVPKEQIVLINALGTHRSNTQEELKEILGAEIVQRYRVIQHDCHSMKDLLSLGKSSARGHEILVNRIYMESTVRILTGFIEPHLFAGFSGGPKAVLPGIAGFQTITANHGVHMIGDPGVGFAKTIGNPIWEEMLDAALRSRPTFLMNITQTEDRQITGVFAGDLLQAHRAGVEFVSNTAMIPVEKPFDIVISTSGGYPLDISMYQAVKGMVVAGQIVKDGGAIILVSECSEGLPDSGEYGDILRLADSPEGILSLIRKPGFLMQDQWDIQLQAQVCKRAQFYIYSEGLTDEEKRLAFGIPCNNVEALVDKLLKEYGPEASIAVLPAGPLSVPHLEE
jgi:nickel-dependent lactate racemase